jgi:hypothetical protein
MNDCSKDLNQTDEGDLLSAAEVSDEVIEAASIMVLRGGISNCLVWHLLLWVPFAAGDRRPSC